MAFGLVACGDDDTATPDADATTTETSPPDDTAPTNEDVDTSSPSETTAETTETETVEATDTSEPDADVGPDPFACLGTDPAYAGYEPGALTYEALLLDTLAQDFLAEVRTRACAWTDPACSAPIFERTTAADGLYTVAVATGFDGLFVHDGGGVMRTIVMHDPPLVAPAMTPPVVDYLVRETDFDALVASTGESYDPDAGHLLVTALDCALAPAEGVTLRLEDATGAVVATTFHTLDQPLYPVPIQATFNLARGWYWVIGTTAGGHEYGRARALVDGATVTRVSLTPQQTTPDRSCKGDARRFVAGDADSLFQLRALSGDASSGATHAKACAPGDTLCTTPIDEGEVIDDRVVLGLGAGFAGFIEVSGPSIATTRYFPSPPIAGGSPLDLPAVIYTVPPGPLAIIGPGVTPSVEVLVRVSDCRLERAHGMVVDVAPALPQTQTTYLSDAGNQTDDSGLALLTKVPLGEPVIVRASDPSGTLGTTSLLPEEGFFHQVDVVPSPVVEARFGPLGHVEVFEDSVFATFVSSGAIVHFSNAPTCVLWTRPADMAFLSAGTLTIGVASEPPIELEPAQCSGDYFYGGPTFPLDASQPVDIAASGGPLMPVLPTQTLASPAPEQVVITSPLPDPLAGLALADDEDLTLTWEVPAAPGELEILTRLYLYPTTPDGALVDLYCAFPVSEGSATIPANVLGELALRYGSGGFGSMHIFAGSQVEAVAGDASYLIEVTRYFDSTTVPFDFPAELQSARVPPPPPEPDPEPVIPEPSGPTPGGAFVCSRGIGGAGLDSIAAVAVADDTIVVVGRFTAATNFGSAATPVTLSPLDASGDVFVARYDGDCELVWAKRAGSAAFDNAVAVAIADDAVFVAGFAGDGAVFGQGELGEATLATTGSDIFFARFDLGDGALAWLRGAQGTSTVALFALAASSDALYAVGRFHDSITFDATTFTNDGPDLPVAFLARFGFDGAFTSAVTAGDGLGADVDFFDVGLIGDEPVVLGNFVGTFTTAGQTFAKPCDVDAFVLRFSEAGALVWGEQLGGDGFDTPNRMSVAADGSIHFVGYTDRPIILGADEPNETYLPSAGGYDGFIGELAGDGSLVAARAASGPFDDFPEAIAPTTNGYVVAGTYGRFGAVGYITLGRFEVNETTLVGPGNDVFVALYDDSGLVWARGAGGAGSDTISGAHVLPSGDIVIVGGFEQAITWGTTTLEAAAASVDGFFTIIRP